jgi:hypothetical protein
VIGGKQQIRLHHADEFNISYAPDQGGLALKELLYAAEKRELIFHGFI